MYQHPWFVAESIRYCQRVPGAGLKSGPGKHSVALAVLLAAMVNRPATMQMNAVEGLAFSGIVSLVPKRADLPMHHNLPVTVELRKRDFETSANLPILSDHLVCSSACWSSALRSPEGPDAESALVPLYVGTPAV